MPERNYPRELEAIMEGLAESVLEASDEEILEEAREAGEDVEESAEGIRAGLLEVMRKQRLEQLRTAREERSRALEKLERAESSLPTSPAARRALLDGVLADHSEVRGLLTAQHRDLSGLSDEDVDSCLRHLQALGVLGNGDAEAE